LNELRIENQLDEAIKETYNITSTIANALFMLNLFTIPNTNVKMRVTEEKTRTIISKRFSWKFAIL